MPIPHKAKKDKTHTPIEKEVVKAGGSFQTISAFNVPDSIIGHDGVTFLMEIKTDVGKLSDGQKEWLWDFNGRALLVRSTDEARQAMGDETHDNPLAPVIPISLRNAIKIAALIMGMEEMRIIRTYILTLAAFKRSKKRKFTETLDDTSKIAMNALARVFGYPETFFWDYFIDRMNAGKLTIITLSEMENHAVATQMIALFSAYTMMLESVSYAKDHEDTLLETYRQLEILDAIPY